MTTSLNDLMWWTHKDDTSPSMEFTLTKRNGTAVDLTDADAVKIRVFRGDGTLLIDEVECQIASPPTGGTVRYDFTADDTAEAGLFYFHFLIEWNDLTRETIPKGWPFKLRIYD